MESWNWPTTRAPLGGANKLSVIIITDFTIVSMGWEWQHLSNNIIKMCFPRVVSSPPTAQRDREPRKTEAMIVGVDRAASQMEDLQSADSLGRVAGGPSLGLLVAPSTHCIHFLPVSKVCIMIMVVMMITILLSCSSPSLPSLSRVPPSTPLFLHSYTLHCW